MSKCHCQMSAYFIIEVQLFLRYSWIHLRVTWLGREEFKTCCSPPPPTFLINSIYTLLEIIQSSITKENRTKKHNVNLQICKRVDQADANSNPHAFMELFWWFFDHSKDCRNESTSKACNGANIGIWENYIRIWYLECLVKEKHAWIMHRYIFLPWMEGQREMASTGKSRPWEESWILPE